MAHRLNGAGGLIDGFDDPRSSAPIEQEVRLSVISKPLPNQSRLVAFRDLRAPRYQGLHTQRPSVHSYPPRMSLCRPRIAFPIGPSVRRLHTHPSPFLRGVLRSQHPDGRRGLARHRKKQLAIGICSADTPLRALRRIRRYRGPCAWQDGPLEIPPGHQTNKDADVGYEPSAARRQRVAR